MLRQVGLHQKTWMPRSLRCAAHSPVGARIYLGMERDARRGRSGLSALALLTPPPVRRSCAPAPFLPPVRDGSDFRLRVLKHPGHVFPVLLRPGR